MKDKNFQARKEEYSKLHDVVATTCQNGTCSLLTSAKL